MGGFSAHTLPAQQPEWAERHDRDLLKKLNLTKEELTGPVVYKLWDACRNGIEGLEFYAFNMIRTKDESDDKHPVKVFPRKPHLQEVFRTLLLDEPPQFIPKSRQMMVTWAVCVYATWLARFHPHKLVFFQSKREEDAANLVFNKDMWVGRCGFIEAHMPSFMYLGRGRKVLEGRYGNLFYPNGSRIWGIAQGEHILRSYVARAVIMDEAAFWPAFRESYRAALAMSKNHQSQIVAITTANPKTFFAEMIGEEESEAA